MRFGPLFALSLTVGLLTGCAGLSAPGLSGFLPTTTWPVMRWDTRPEAATWTSRALRAVSAHDPQLAARIPADIGAFCPGYADTSRANRRAFWVGLLSATAKHESTFNPKASGGGGRYIGLMQISPGTARQAGCTAQSSAALKDGAANLECAVRILAPHVAEDGLVAGKGNRGMARDWGPLTRKSKRADIAAWTSAQPYCTLKNAQVTR